MKIEFTYNEALKGNQIGMTAIVSILLALWIIALIDQLFAFTAFQNGMMRHALPPGIARVVGWAIPIAEAIIIFLLMAPRTTQWGLWLSAFLLFTFTAYIGLGLMTSWIVFECFCSKFINNLSWWGHFWLNASLLAVSLAGILLYRKLHRSDGVRDAAAEGGSA